MKYDLKTPCDKCPFKRGASMLLTEGRIIDIEHMFSRDNGSEFSPGGGPACTKLPNPSHPHVGA